MIRCRRINFYRRWRFQIIQQQWLPPSLSLAFSSRCRAMEQGDPNHTTEKRAIFFPFIDPCSSLSVAGSILPVLAEADWAKGDVNVRSSAKICIVQYTICCMSADTTICSPSHTNTSKITKFIRRLSFEILSHLLLPWKCWRIYVDMELII